MTKRITVHIRYNNSSPLWHIKDNTLYQRINGTTQLSYPCYQNVFSHETTNEIYNKCVKQAVAEFLDKINCTIFAYGQTGTGKTYTIFGDEESPGLITLALKDVLKHSPVEISYLEIYNEQINDLIDLENKVRIFSTNNTSIVNNTTKVRVNNLQMATEIIKKCESRRKIGQTEYNDKSSRSHTIFQIYLNNKILSLIDLAGSERATGDLERRKEGAFINRSLLALGTVVNGLIKNKYVNYRDSKLTRILQSSLDGSCNVISICMISTKAECLSESLSTLNFAARLSEIELDKRNERYIRSKTCECKCCLNRKELIPIIYEIPKETVIQQNVIQDYSIIKEEKKEGLMYLKSELDLYIKRVDALEEMITKLLVQNNASRIKELFVLEKNMFYLQLELIKRRKNADDTELN